MSADGTHRVRQGKQPDGTGRRPTRNDVAERAGVSTAVVSYVMNDGPRKVAPATRQKVLDAVQELGYQPNDAARSLRSQSTRVVGLLGHSTLGSSFGALATGISDTLEAHSYLVTVSSVGDDDLDLGLRAARRFIAKRVDGVVVTPGVATADLLKLFGEESIPVVVVGALVPGAASVLADPAEVARVAAQYLVELGHQRIAVLRHRVGGEGTPADSVDYVRELESAGAEVDPALVLEVSRTVEAGIDAASHLATADQPPTALIVENDLVALGAMDALKRAGSTIPHDYSIVGLTISISASS